MAQRREDDPHKPTGETLQFMQVVWNLAHALDVRSKRMARTLGVTGPQRLVIRVIGQSPDLTASEIAATLGLHPSTLSGVLSRLEGHGFLERVVDPADRRRVRFKLTASGRRIDTLRKGTVEAAVRRSLARADDATVERAREMLTILIDELVNGD